MIVQSTLMNWTGGLVTNDIRCYCTHTHNAHYFDTESCTKCMCSKFRMDLSVTQKVTVYDEKVIAYDEKGPAAIPDSGLKDSGVRTQYGSGMVRDAADDKPRFDLVIPVGIPYDKLMLTRWAELLRKGAIKYSERNWEKADSDEELDRAKASAFRHFMQWFSDETDEDHAAAVFFNINEVETIRTKWSNQQKEG